MWNLNIKIAKILNKNTKSESICILLGNFYLQYFKIYQSNFYKRI